jgi:starvation-inducible DNA-binding protein
MSLESTHIDLTGNVRAKAIGLLAPALASAIDLSRHAKQAHWNVRGPDFIALHEFFDTLYTAGVAMTDEIAERIATLGGMVESRLAETAKASVLPAFPDTHDAKAILTALTASFAGLANLCRKNIDAADEMGDKVTADLFTRIAGELDKKLWFIEGHIR